MMDEQSFKDWRDRVEAHMERSEKFLFRGNGEPALTVRLARLSDALSSLEKSIIRKFEDLTEEAKAVARTEAERIKQDAKDYADEKDKRFTRKQQLFGLLLALGMLLMQVFGPQIRQSVGHFFGISTSAISAPLQDNAEQRTQ